MEVSPRDKIILSAVKLFSTKGFDATSVDEIARNSGINKAMIYYYFSSKEELLVSIIKKSIDEFYRIIEEMDISSFSSLRDFIRMLVVNVVDYIVTHRDVVKIFFREGFVYGDKIGTTVGKMLLSVFEDLILRVRHKFSLSDTLSYVDCAIMTNLVAGIIHLESGYGGEEFEVVKSSYIDKVSSVIFYLVTGGNFSGGEV
ncbi:MAG: TetR/AcrR family transcriptional regulator [Brevinematia bacterium]